MPSSPEAATVATAATATTVTAASWQPQPLHPGMLPVTEITLPVFEVDQPAAPAVRAFALSGSATIPAEVLASATASARAAGYAEGWASGLADARSATAARLAAEAAAAQAAAAQQQAAASRALAALFDAADDLERRAAPAVRDAEEQIVAAAWAIAQALVGDVLADDDRRSRAAVTRALALAPVDEDVVVRVSEGDFAVLRGEAAGIAPPPAAPSVSGMTVPSPYAPFDGAEPIRQQRGLRTVTIMPDAAVSPGDAIASCGATTIDARLSAALDRVQEVLNP